MARCEDAPCCGHDELNDEEDYGDREFEAYGYDYPSDY